MILSRRKAIIGGAALITSAAAARAQLMMMTGAGLGTASAPYSGPGDILTAKAWWGLRGYNAAYTGAAIDLSDASTGVYGGTVNILAGGSLDIATATSLVGANKTQITKIYDQTGGGSDLTQIAGVTNRAPVLSLTDGPGGAYPAITWTLSPLATNLNGVSTFTQAQPLFFSGVWYGTSSTTIMTALGDPSGGTVQAGFNGFANSTAYLYAGNVGAGWPAVTINAWQATTYLFNGASSAIAIQGIETTGINGGTDGYTVSDPIFMGSNGAGSQPWEGFCTEMGIFAGTYSAPQLASLTANQRNGGGLWTAF